MMDSFFFKNLKIIDLSTVLAGPSVGSFFGELGADVLKIEHPNHPDVTREWKLPQEEKESPVSAYFSSVNFKKKYLKLNLKSDDERNQLLELVRDADVVLMNYKYGDQEKLKITDEVLRKENPQLIIGKINGFGPKNDRVAYDLVLQAETGFMSMNGTPESGPVKMPVALIDVLAGHHLKQGILVELINRNTTCGYGGKTISVSLYDAAICSLVNQASNYLMAHETPQRIGSLHPNIAPYGELFKTADNRTLTFAVGSNLHFEKLCDFLDVPELAESPNFNTSQERLVNRKDLYEILYPLIKQFDADTVLQAMEEAAVPCGEIKDLEAVFESPQAQNLIRKEIIDGQMTKRVTGIAFQTN